MKIDWHLLFRSTPMRVGEIAALKIGDVINQHGEVRPEIKLGAHQTKGSKGLTVILSIRIRRETGAYLKSQPERRVFNCQVCGGTMICGRQNLNETQEEFSCLNSGGT